MGVSSKKNYEIPTGNYLLHKVKIKSIGNTFFDIFKNSPKRSLEMGYFHVKLEEKHFTINSHYIVSIEVTAVEDSI